jgi:hypothetical protein
LFRVQSDDDGLQLHHGRLQRRSARSDDAPGADSMMRKFSVLTQNKAKLCQNLIITLVFEKKRQFFRRKLAKIAENCAHNIGPWSRFNESVPAVIYLQNLLGG